MGLYVMKLTKNIIFGGISGFLNGLFGAGGGMVVVPSIRSETGTKEAHATSIAIILPISIVSAISYILRGNVKIQSALPYIPFGVIGAIIGIILMKKFKPNIIRKIFALVMLWAGLRMIFI